MELKLLGTKSPIKRRVKDEEFLKKDSYLFEIMKLTLTALSVQTILGLHKRQAVIIAKLLNEYPLQSKYRK